MELNTTPGPDHTPIEFCQVCWEIVNADLGNLFSQLWENKLDLERLNYGVITLIPKVKETNTIKQYRPICLLNVSFKIITKALMLRVEDCLGRIINDCQTTFLKNRNIMDGVLSLHEILHDTKIRGKDGIVLKLYFEIAYDKISWDFLF